MQTQSDANLEEIDMQIAMLLEPSDIHRRFNVDTKMPKTGTSPYRGNFVSQPHLDFHIMICNTASKLTYIKDCFND